MPLIATPEIELSLDSRVVSSVEPEAGTTSIRVPEPAATLVRNPGSASAKHASAANFLRNFTRKDYPHQPMTGSSSFGGQGAPKSPGGTLGPPKLNRAENRSPDQLGAASRPRNGLLIKHFILPEFRNGAAPLSAQQ